MSCEVSLDNAASLAFSDDGFRRYADHRAIVHIVGKTWIPQGPLRTE